MKNSFNFNASFFHYIFNLRCNSWSITIGKKLTDPYWSFISTATMRPFGMHLEARHGSQKPEAQHALKLLDQHFMVQFVVPIFIRCRREINDANLARRFFQALKKIEIKWKKLKCGSEKNFSYHSKQLYHWPFFDLTPKKLINLSMELKSLIDRSTRLVWNKITKLAFETNIDMP